MYAAAPSTGEINNKKKTTAWPEFGFHSLVQAHPQPGGFFQLADPSATLPPEPFPPENSGDERVKEHARLGDVLENKKLEPFGFAYPIRGHGAGAENGKCLCDLFWSHFA